MRCSVAAMLILALVVPISIAQDAGITVNGFRTDRDPPPVGANPDVALVVHYQTAGHDCSYDITDCDSVVTSAPTDGSPFDVIVAVANAPAGFIGVQFTLEWTGGWGQHSWQYCCDYVADPFDGTSGDYVELWWDEPQRGDDPEEVFIDTPLPDCQNPGQIGCSCDYKPGVVCKPAGVHDPDGGFNAVMPEIDLFDCWDDAGGSSRVVGNGRAGYIEIKGGEGCNPCFAPCYWEQPVPVESMAWGTIKSLYR